MTLSYGWQYFGSASGVFRTFPARAWHDVTAAGCSAFEFRTASWYVSGSTGPKNVIIMLDLSWSMREESRLTVGIAAIAAVLSTLGPSDWFGVVAFNSSAYSFASMLTPATASNIASAQVSVPLKSVLG